MDGFLVFSKSVVPLKPVALKIETNVFGTSMFRPWTQPALKMREVTTEKCEEEILTVNARMFEREATNNIPIRKIGGACRDSFPNSPSPM